MYSDGPRRAPYSKDDFLTELPPVLRRQFLHSVPFGHPTIPMNITINDNQFIIFMEKRLDSLTSDEWNEELNQALTQMPPQCECIVLDAENLSYISSSGIRVILNLRKTVEKPISMRNVSLEIYEILKMTGITEMMDIQKKQRQISIEGCELIGSGYRGDVYRLDGDTVVKVYKCSPEEAKVLIQSEQYKARLAIIHGIPTALPYDEVHVGDALGSVFELVDAKSFHAVFTANPGNAPEIIRQYVSCIKTVHQTVIENEGLPSARDKYLRELDSIEELLPAQLFARLKELLTALPEDHHLVHGDIMMKNVMFSQNEPILIDMDTLCTGHGIFDLQALCVTYQLFSEDDPENSHDFLQMTDEEADRLWQTLLKDYFETEDPAILSAVSDEIRVAASIHFLYLLKTLHLLEGDMASRRLTHTREHLEELLGRVKRLGSWKICPDGKVVCDVLPEEPEEESAQEESCQFRKIPWPKADLPEEIRRITGIFDRAGYELYLVGGCVRDMILGHRPNDYDFVTNADAEAVLALMKSHGYTCEDQYLFLNYVPVLIGQDNEKIDISAFNGGSLAADLQLRDVTINSMAYDVRSGEILDCMGGFQDICDGIIRLNRPLTDEDNRIILRMIRFSLELGFKIDPDSYQNALDSVGIMEGIRTSALIKNVKNLLAGGKEVLVEGKIPKRPEIRQ